MFRGILRFSAAGANGSSLQAAAGMISVFGLWYQSAIMAAVAIRKLSPETHRARSRLAAAFESETLRLFEGRILSFDLEAERAYALLMSAARARGVPISIADGQIAAIAKANGFSVAARDEAPFRAAGLNVANPWAE
jgi:predicted nucleic acid-binding protein